MDRFSRACRLALAKSYSSASCLSRSATPGARCSPEGSTCPAVKAMRCRQHQHLNRSRLLPPSRRSSPRRSNRIRCPRSSGTCRGPRPDYSALCKSDWLPSSLILVIAAVREDVDDPVVLPAVPVLDPPYCRRRSSHPSWRSSRTNPPPRDALPAAQVEEPAPVERAPLEPAPDVPVAPSASLWRQPVTVTCA